PPSRPSPAHGARGRRRHLGGALPARRLCAPAAAQSRLPHALFPGPAAARAGAALRLSGMTPARHLVVFLRAPRLGRVKSRLAAGIGALATLRFYRLATAQLLRRVARNRRWRSHVWITPDSAARHPPWRGAARWQGQGGGDLGRRMARVF